VLRRRLIVAILALVVAAWIAASMVLFLFPDEGAPVRADAVVVLSGTRGSRLAKALELMRDRVAPVLVISNDPQTPVREAIHLCRAGRGPTFRVICFEPDPDSTRGEARAVGTLARAHNWRSLVLVTSGFHVTRARMLFRRCYHGKLDAVGVSYPIWTIPKVVISEWAKLAYATVFARGC
jgi:uncharacterized SAM-binding protein YcdF (DUF218 family)